MKKILSYRLFEMQGRHFQELHNLVRSVDDPEEAKILGKAREEILDRMAKYTNLSKDALEEISLSTEDWQFSPDKRVIAKSNVYLGGKNIESLKPFNFEKAEKNFSIWGNKLESLEGSPEIVGGDFDAERNPLKNLVGGPKKVGGDYKVGSFKYDLLSLDGAPEEVGGNFLFVSPSSSNIKTNMGEYNLEGFLKLLSEVDRSNQEEDVPFIFSHPFFSQKGSAKKVYSENTKEIAKVWNFVPEDFKKRIAQETGESPENVQDSIQKFSDLDQKFF
jgi:hypothetical protein